MAILVCKQCGRKNRVQDVSEVNRKPVCGACGSPLSREAPAGRLSPERPNIVTDATFAIDVLQDVGAPILLDCWAPWCGPCRMIAPVLDQLARESGGKYFIAKLNVDENPRTAGQFDIRSIPTLLVFKNGAMVDRIVGAQPKEAITACLNRHI